MIEIRAQRKWRGIKFFFRTAAIFALLMLSLCWVLTGGFDLTVLTLNIDSVEKRGQIAEFLILLFGVSAITSVMMEPV